MILSTLRYLNVSMVLVCASCCLAAAVAHAGTKQHSAHEHGAAQLNIAFEGQTGTIQFESPSDSIYGFEHVAKSPKDKKAMQAAVDLFTNNLSKAFVFADTAKCKMVIKKLDPQVIEKDEGHSEFRAEITVTCQSVVAGTKMGFGLSKLFPGVKTLQVQAISGEKQTGAAIKNDKGTLVL